MPLQGWDCRDRGFEGVEVFVVVVPRHRRGLVPDDGLDDMQRNARQGPRFLV